MNVIEDIGGLVSNKIEVFKTIYAIVKLETRLAGLSILPIILNTVMILVVVMTLWSSMMILVGHSLVQFFSSFVAGVLGVMCLNLMLVFGLIQYLSFNLKNMSFEKTRAYFNRRETSNAYVTATPTRKIEPARKKMGSSSTKRK